MSTSSTVSSSPILNRGVQDEDDDDQYSALLIAVSLMAVIIALLLVRLAFNFFIDICILCDSQAAYRNCAEFARHLWPFGRANDPEPERRTSPETPLSEEAYQELWNNYWNALLPGYIWKDTPHDTAANDDTEPMRTANKDDDLPDAAPSSLEAGGGGTGGGVPCSICLQPLVPGQSVHRVAHCGHLFHTPCLQQWLWSSKTFCIPDDDDDRGNNHCPNCRAPVLSTADWDAAQRWMQQHHVRPAAERCSSNHLSA